MFTLDIGSGTQDFLLYKEDNMSSSTKELFCKNIRNSLKMILPSPTKIIAKKIKLSKDVLLYGYTMGGGACKKAIIEHIKKYNVFATEKAALTFSDDLNKVKDMGIKIVNNASLDDFHSKKLQKIEMKDVNWEFFYKILKELNLNFPEKLIVAVQDHGFSTKESNRRYRFKLFEKKLKKNAKLSDFVYFAGACKSDKDDNKISKTNKIPEIPETYNRMRSVAESFHDFCNNTNFVNQCNPKLHIVDTVFAAMAGCMFEVTDFPALLLNFGNSHFVGAVVDKDGEIYSMFEHHTKVIEKKDEQWLKNFIKKFINGEISFEDVYNDGGHGAYVRDVVDVKDVVSTGPRIDLSLYRITKSSGDLMVAGNIGMIKLMESIYKE